MAFPLGDYKDQLVSYLTLQQSSQFSKAAALTVVAHDIISNMDAEIEHIWSTTKRGFHLNKVVYIFLRYWVIAFIVYDMYTGTTQHTIQACKTFYAFYSFAGTVTHCILVDTLCIMRIYALYGKSKRILGVCVSLSAIAISLALYVSEEVYRAIAKGVFAPFFIEMKGCYTLPPPTDKTYLAWIPWLSVALTFFCLTLYKLRESARAINGNATPIKLKDFGSFSPLLSIVIRDGSWFFVLIVIIIVIQISFTVKVDGSYYPSVQPWVLTAYSCSCSRLVLNLYNYGGDGGATKTLNDTGHVMSDLKFKERPGFNPSRSDFSRTGFSTIGTFGTASTAA